MRDMVWHRHAEEQRRQCAQGPCRTHFNGEHLLAQFTLEHVLYDFFRQSCVRTRNPDEADLFFVTHFGDILYRGYGKEKRPVALGAGAARPRREERRQGLGAHLQHLCEILAETARRGPHPRPAGARDGLRHPKGVRGWGHYLQQLTAPVWISLELSKSFAGEYPACAQKNIVAPYPIPGRGWHNGEWGNVAATAQKRLLDPHLPSGDGRPLTTYFRAGDHGCVPVRKAIKREFKNAARSRGGDRRPGLCPPGPAGQDKRRRHF